MSASDMINCGHVADLVRNAVATQQATLPRLVEQMRAQGVTTLELFSDWHKKKPKLDPLAAKFQCLTWQIGSHVGNFPLVERYNEHDHPDAAFDGNIGYFTAAGRAIVNQTREVTRTSSESSKLPTWPDDLERLVITRSEGTQFRMSHEAWHIVVELRTVTNVTK